MLQNRIVLDVGASSRELETCAYELATVRDRVHRGSVLVQDVDLFEGQTLGLKRGISLSITSGRKNTNLRDAEVGENETSGTGGPPYEEHLNPETSGAGLRVDQVRGSVTNTKVPEPVGGDGE